MRTKRQLRGTTSIHHPSTALRTMRFATDNHQSML